MKHSEEKRGNCPTLLQGHTNLNETHYNTHAVNRNACRQLKTGITLYFPSFSGVHLSGIYLSFIQFNIYLALLTCMFFIIRMTFSSLWAGDVSATLKRALGFGVQTHNLHVWFSWGRVLDISLTLSVSLFFFKVGWEERNISGLRRTVWETAMSLGQWSMNCLMRTWGISLGSSKGHMAYSSCYRWLLNARGARGSGASQL